VLNSIPAAAPNIILQNTLASKFHLLLKMGFKVIVSLNAFTHVWCAEAGIRGLSRRVTQSANGVATHLHKVGVGLTPKT
jgi:hypothetical protein